MKLSSINSVITEANWYNGKKYGSVIELLIQFYEDVSEKPGELYRWFVSMTKIDKLGVNPMSKYKTPIGIYSYPLSYVVSFNRIYNLPFAGKEPFINLFRIKDDTNMVSVESDPDEYISRLYGIGDNGKNYTDEDLQKLYTDVYSDISDHGYELRSNFSVVWLSTRIVADLDPIAWNTELRKIGVDGVYDTGTGTIHPSEKTQSVLLSTSNIDKVIRLINTEVATSSRETGDKFEKALVYNIKKGDYNNIPFVARMHKAYSSLVYEMIYNIVDRLQIWDKLYDILKSFSRESLIENAHYSFDPIDVNTIKTFISRSIDSDNPRMLMPLWKLLSEMTGGDIEYNGMFYLSIDKNSKKIVKDLLYKQDLVNKQGNDIDKIIKLVDVVTQWIGGENAASKIARDYIENYKNEVK